MDRLVSKPVASISSDIDTLQSIYQGRGCSRPGGYSHSEFSEGLEEFGQFLESFSARATLFMVGRDFLRTSDNGIIRNQHSAGHEIANHTMTHAQGLRLLPLAEQEREIREMEELCLRVVGVRPVGFRAPGWNIDDHGAEILKKRGYLYDSSVFPTSVMPALKMMHWRSTWTRPAIERTTLGRLSYALAPRRPYRTASTRLGRRGDAALIELPVTVTPTLRLPFFATWLLATGFAHFRRAYRRIRSQFEWLQFQFHLSDFVDYGRDEYRNQVPSRGTGVYVPQALRTPLREKRELFRRAISLIAEDYSFVPLREIAERQAIQQPRKA